MDKKEIVDKASRYVSEYRKNLPKINRTERPISNYRMITIFLGSGLEACMTKVRKTISDLFSNHKSIPKILFSDEEIKNEILIRNRIKDACDNLFTDGGIVRDGSRICICFVMDSDFEDSVNCISVIQDELVKNLSFSIGSTGIDYNFFTLANTRTRLQAERLGRYIDNLNNVLLSVTGTPCGNVTSYIVGDMYDEKNTFISDINRRYEAIGSCMVLVNSTKGAMAQAATTSNEPTKHNLIGFSQADIPLNTLYVIGFDVFSDIVIDYSTKNRLGVSSYAIRFSIEEMFKDKILSLKSLSSRLISGADYLYIPSIKAPGRYSFDDINDSMGGILDKYFEINLNKELLKMDPHKVRSAFNAYLIEEFKKFGLEHANKCLEEIILKEKKAKRDFNRRDFRSESYDYNPSNVIDTVKKIISAMTITAIDDTLKKARDIIINMEDDNILTRINTIFNETKIATEKCKKECALQDDNVTEHLLQKYENMVSENMDRIINAVDSGDITLSFESQESFDEVLFNSFEQIIASRVLFPKQNNYVDDLETLKNEVNGYERWIKRQIDKTYFTLKLSEIATGKLSEESICFLTDLSRSEKMWAIMEQKQYNIIEASGVSVFRVFRFRKNISKDDIFALYHLN